jgi:hypothetical protein
LSGADASTTAYGSASGSSGSESASSGTESASTRAANHANKLKGASAGGADAADTDDSEGWAKLGDSPKTNRSRALKLSKVTVDTGANNGSDAQEKGESTGDSTSGADDADGWLSPKKKRKAGKGEAANGNL